MITLGRAGTVGCDALRRVLVVGPTQLVSSSMQTFGVSGYSGGSPETKSVGSENKEQSEGPTAFSALTLYLQDSAFPIFS